MKQVAQTVKRIQRTHNLNKTELAERLKVSRRTVGRLLDAANGNLDYEPSLETAYQVAKLVGVGIEDANKRFPAFLIETAI